MADERLPDVQVGLGEPGYRAFLVRCWKEAGAGHGGEVDWRFTLVKIDSQRDTRGFSSLEKLIAYLREELEL